MRSHTHATIEKLHVTQFHCIQGFFSILEGRVDFFLEAVVCPWVDQEVIEEARKDTACCV